MPPCAIVRGPADVPVGENGCCASATRILPSGLLYRCASAGAAGSHAAVTARLSAINFSIENVLVD
jgi:hypothetical protein